MAITGLPVHAYGGFARYKSTTTSWSASITPEQEIGMAALQVHTSAGENRPLPAFVLQTAVALVDPEVCAVAVPVGGAFSLGQCRGCQYFYILSTSSPVGSTHQARIKRIAPRRHGVGRKHKQPLRSLPWRHPLLDKVVAEDAEVDAVAVDPLEVRGGAADGRDGGLRGHACARVCCRCGGLVGVIDGGKGGGEGGAYRSI